MPSRQQRRVELIDRHTRSVSGSLLSRLPAPAKLLEGYSGENSIELSREYVRSEFDEDDESTADAIADGQRDGFMDGWSDLDIDHEPDDGPNTRLGRLLGEGSVVTRTLSAAFVVRAASALLGGKPESVVEAAEEVSKSMWEVEMTTCLVAGTQDGCEELGIAKVRLFVAGGECLFCSMYDGRIMDFDHDAGMPPFHAGCACDIEPLKE